MSNIYRYVGKGLALGAVIIVTASSKATADKRAEACCKKMDLDWSTFALVEVRKFDPTKALYFWNGDY